MKTILNIPQILLIQNLCKMTFYKKNTDINKIQKALPKSGSERRTRSQSQIRLIDYDADRVRDLQVPRELRRGCYQGHIFLKYTLCGAPVGDYCWLCCKSQGANLYDAHTLLLYLLPSCQWYYFAVPCTQLSSFAAAGQSGQWGHFINTLILEVWLPQGCS